MRQSRLLSEVLRAARQVPTGPDASLPNRSGWPLDVLDVATSATGAPETRKNRNVPPKVPLPMINTTRIFGYSASVRNENHLQV